jgi:hypothetical protein
MVAQFDKITIDKFCELTIASEKAKDLQATFEEKQDLIETDILEQKFSSATTIIEKADVLLALQNLKPKTQVGRKKREELIESYKNKVVTTDSPISSHSLTYHSPVEDFVNAQEELKKLEESKTLSKKDLDAEKKLYVEKFLTTEQPIDPNLFLKTKSSLSERLKTLDRKPRDPIFKLAKDLDTTIQKMRTALADIEKTCEELTILTDIEQAIRRQMSLVEEAKNAVQLDQFDPKVPVAKTLKRKIQGDHSIDASRKFILEELKKRKAAISGKTPIGEIEKLLNEIGEIGKTMLFSEEQTQEFNGLKQSVSTLKDSRSLP